MQLGTEQFDQVAMARDMIMRGYINNAVKLETQLSMKTIRTLRSKLTAEGLAKNPRGRQIRQGQSIIKRSEDREDVTILMLAYRNYGGENILMSVDINALNLAYDTYVLVKSEINRHPVDFITINDAYGLAQELRSDDAMFEQCASCDLEYFISIRQECSTKCPFCAGPSHAIAPAESVVA
ncbi:FlhC family transcriptional regulator [Halomonas sp. LBP4]|uniref:FlhC family transcriptional regulator n=1 Tax=Halomonas sp. LBP4 TaxID=2044917 RepID=UPI000D75D375|nr:FlhC family transcriptional regulator [Halomonas sp. LBP4]PXX95938.1 hypothetical protein CR157_17240 [Halomonas sp. LBP4]